MLDNSTDAISPLQLVKYYQGGQHNVRKGGSWNMKTTRCRWIWALLLNNIHDKLKTKGEKEDVYSKILVDELFDIEMQINFKNMNNRG